MARSFVVEGPPRVVFGPGSEARVADELVAAGAERVLIVALDAYRDGADRVATALGDRSVGMFTDLAQHVPLDHAERARQMAREAGADWVLAHGGGTAVGFAKAIALTAPVKVAAVPTTYAGSERTSVWGVTHPDGKRTGRAERVRPSLVIYDPELTLALPKALSLTSLFNAIAHTVSLQWSPPTEQAAEEAAEATAALVAGLRALDADPDDLGARTEAMFGAYRAAACIEIAPLGLHHLLAHTLGGSLGVSHSAGHTAVLPYSTGYNGVAAPEVIARLRPALGDDPPARLYDLARDLGLPHSLKGVDVARDQLPMLVDKALERNYPNPRPYDEAALARLLDDAFHARRPSLFSRRRALPLRGVHAGRDLTERGAPLEEAKAVVIAVHGRGAAADRIARDVEDRGGRGAGLTVLAPQALDNTWYPHGFAEPLEANQPWFDDAVQVLDTTWQRAVAQVGADRVVVVGFSQGGCLALSWARLRGRSPAALLAWSAAELDVGGSYEPLAGRRVHLSKSAGDPWIPQQRFDRTAATLQEQVPGATVHIAPGDAHAITEADAVALREAVAVVLA